MIGRLPFATELQGAVGEKMLVHPRDCAAFAVSGVVPKLVVSPTSVEEAAQAAKVIAAEQESLIVRGSGTKSRWPPALDDVFAVLDMSRCEGVVAHEPADLTVTVAAGTKIAHLQSVLARHEQFFPCDPPFAAWATVGGTIAANANGALRQRYGTLRDNTLGLRVALSDGSVAFFGAHVVKSVAGYDAHKLFIGSFGTLGAIAEATLKVAPLPKVQALFAARFVQCGDALRAALDIASSSLFVLAIALHDAAAAARIARMPEAAASGDWLLLVRCGGDSATVRRQVDGVASRCKIAGARDLFQARDEMVSNLWHDVAELAGGERYDASFAVGKFVSLPTDIAAVLSAVHHAWPQAEVTAHPASGVAFVHIPTAQIALAAQRPQELWKKLERIGATATWLAAPRSEGRELRNFRPSGEIDAYQIRVRRALDPNGVFDPNRSVPGSAAVTAPSRNDGGR